MGRKNLFQIRKLTKGFETDMSGIKKLEFESIKNINFDLL